nr:hypothetical protein [uncultured Cohaesibacter sp.]
MARDVHCLPSFVPQEWSTTGHPVRSGPVHPKLSRELRLSGRELALSGAKKFYSGKKMKLFDKGMEKISIVCCENITLQNIPLEAYEYIANGKITLE